MIEVNPSQQTEKSPKAFAIKQVREDWNLSQQDFADQLGVSLSAVRNWESGRTAIRDRHLMQIAKQFKVDPIVFGEEYSAWDHGIFNGQLGSIKNRDQLIGVLDSLSDTKGTIAIDVQNTGTTEILSRAKVEQECKKFGITTERVALHRCVGDDFEPQIKKGQLMLIDVSAEEIEGASLYVLKRGEVSMLRACFQTMMGKIVCRTQNQAFDDSFEGTMEELVSAGVKVAGRVICNNAENLKP